MKSVNDPLVSQMEALSEKLGACANFATPAKVPINRVRGGQFQRKSGAEGES
jgi:hypothetical protein